MAEPRALVQNASDPQQVRFAVRKERQEQERYRAALAGVMRTVEGRALLWNLLERAGVFRSVWSPSAAIHYNAGRQDFGHELMAWMLEVDEEGYQQMEREARAWLRGRAREIDAVQSTHTKEEA